MARAMPVSGCKQPSARPLALAGSRHHSNMKDRNPVLSKIGTRALHWHNWSQISSEWEKICEHSDASFFLSKEWVETWLETFGEELKPEILVFESQGATV